MAWVLEARAYGHFAHKPHPFDSAVLEERLIKPDGQRGPGAGHKEGWSRKKEQRMGCALLETSGLSPGVKTKKRCGTDFSRNMLQIDRRPETPPCDEPQGLGSRERCMRSQGTAFPSLPFVSLTQAGRAREGHEAGDTVCSRVSGGLAAGTSTDLAKVGSLPGLASGW